MKTGFNSGKNVLSLHYKMGTAFLLREIPVFDTVIILMTGRVKA